MNTKYSYSVSQQPVIFKGMVIKEGAWIGENVSIMVLALVEIV
jgi:acetyltransferase-like isoleucine patch superfamily enzyme